MKKTLLALSTISALTSASEVYFIEPANGDKFKGDVKVVFGLSSVSGRSLFPIPAAIIIAL